jgi:hypothetical protein
MPARSAPAAGAAALALLVACSQPSPGGPVPLGVAPRQGAPSAPVPVEISGVGFDASVKTDYGGGSGVVRAQFAARLVPWDGGAPAELVNVALVSTTRLTAVVPAGLAPGRYDLVVVDPTGRSGALPDAFEVATTAADVTALRIDPVGAQRAGIPFAVTVSAVDGAGRVVGAWAGSAALRDATGTAVPSTIGPFQLGVARADVTVLAPRAANFLTVDDGAGHAGASNAFDVATGAPAFVAFASPPSASASACSPAFELELRDAAGAPAPAEAQVTVALQPGPPGALATFSDASCAVAAPSVTFAAGAVRAAFHLRASAGAAAAGSARLRAVPDLYPSAETDVPVAP